MADKVIPIRRAKGAIDKTNFKVCKCGHRIPTTILSIAGGAETWKFVSAIIELQCSKCGDYAVCDKQAKPNA